MENPINNGLGGTRKLATALMPILRTASFVVTCTARKRGGGTILKEKLC